jgi:hypothetical protein
LSRWGVKVALRRLRRFAREGVPEELDLDGTIEGTARNAGWLDLKLQPERRNVRSPRTPRMPARVQGRKPNEERSGLPAMPYRMDWLR